MRCDRSGSRDWGRPSTRPCLGGTELWSLLTDPPASCRWQSMSLPGRGAAHPHKMLLGGPAQSLQGSPPRAPLQGKGTGSKHTVAGSQHPPVPWPSPVLRQRGREPGPTQAWGGDGWGRAWSCTCARGCPRAWAMSWADLGETIMVGSRGSRGPGGWARGGAQCRVGGKKEGSGGERGLGTGRRCHHPNHCEDSCPGTGHQKPG